VCHFLESSPAYQRRPDSRKVARPQRSGRMAFLRWQIHQRRLGVAVHRRVAPEAPVVVAADPAGAGDAAAVAGDGGRLEPGMVPTGRGLRPGSRARASCSRRRPRGCRPGGTQTPGSAKRAQRHCPWCRSQFPTMRSNRRPLRKARASTWFCGPPSRHLFQSSPVETTSVMPRVPGPRYSSRVPTAPPTSSARGRSGRTACPRPPFASRARTRSVPGPLTGGGGGRSRAGQHAGEKKKADGVKPTSAHLVRHVTFQTAAHAAHPSGPATGAGACPRGSQRPSLGGGFLQNRWRPAAAHRVQSSPSRRSDAQAGGERDPSLSSRRVKGEDFDGADVLRAV
jgi:hypothetical protein